MQKSIFAILLASGIAAAGMASPAQAGVLFSNGFESDLNGWNAYGAPYDPTRVSSGTNGITSASGSFHAESSASGSAGNWGGENFGAGDGVPTAFQEYWTSADIFLNLQGGWANDTRFDFDSSISNSAGGFLRDFIFNGGFYNDSDSSPGSGTDRFIFSASNNSQPGSAYAKNPGRSPIAIETTGWYTFEDHFFDNSGTLADTLSIYDSSHALIASWMLSSPTDLIGGVGGNQYAYFSDNDFSVLAFDNTQLRVADAVTAVPEPATIGFLAAGLAGLGAMRRRRKSKA